MANKFIKKEWVDRQSQYPSRRKLTQTTVENVYEVERAEGDVPEPGDAFDAANMNDIEDRVYNAFGLLDGTDISILDTANHFTSNNVEGALSELFMYASDGKKKIANAIGGSPSDTFSQLAALAGEIKIDRDTGKILVANAIGGSPNSSFSELATLAGSIKQDRDNGKVLVANAIGATRNGTASSSESFQQLANRIKNDKVSIYTVEITQDSATLNTGTKFPYRMNFGFTPKYVFLEGFMFYLDGSLYRTTLSNMGKSYQGYAEIILSDVNAQGFNVYVIDTLKPDISLQSGVVSKVYAFG